MHLHREQVHMDGCFGDVTIERPTSRIDFADSVNASLTIVISTGKSATPRSDRHVPAGKVESEEGPEGDVAK